MTEPPPDLVAAEARRWLGEAGEELRIARYLSNDDTLPARAACFHAHLTAEKALKAVLIQRGVPLRRLHDLIALQRMLPSVEQQRFSNSDLDELNPWTIEGRYPADLGDVATARIARLLDAADRVLNSAQTAIENTGSRSREPQQHPTSGQTGLPEPNQQE